ncbi:MAG TPA: cytochrome c biogenesis protein CcsA [Acidobacteriota bacterium]|nr:cytochrome c biogenesis protein CcsA [Acidobacteriota bacterium]
MSRLDRFLLLLVFLMMPIALYAAFIYAPQERVMGVVQRIFYFHVSSAWTGLLSFFFVFLGGALYLLKKDKRYDHFAYAAAELGVLFTTIVIVTGPIWAKPVWNVWWTWDPRLTSTFVLWLIFVAYLMLRSSLAHHPSIRTYASVYGIIGFVDVPIVYLSIYWWRTIHPRVITPEKVDLDPRMWYAVLICFLTILIFYAILMRMRMKLERLKEHVQSLQDYLEDD